MSQIKQLLRLHSQGMPVKRIARTLGISRNTVKGYLRKVAAGTKPLRLKSILKDNDIVILASELILIELATERKKGLLFKQLFKKVKIKSKTK